MVSLTAILSIRLIKSESVVSLHSHKQPCQLITSTSARK